MAREVDRWGIDPLWNTDDESDLFERHPDGRWVRFEDHDRLVRELEAEIERLRIRLAEETAEADRLFGRLGGARFHAGD